MAKSKSDYSVVANDVPPTLIEAVQAGPMDRAAYAAYAAHLSAKRDPHGEVIALALAADALDADRGTKTRATKALKDFVENRVLIELPELADVFRLKAKDAGSIKWRWGVIEPIDTFFWKKSPELDAAVERLMRSPLVAFVRTLWWRSFDTLRDVSPLSALAGLQQLSLASNPNVVALPSCARLQLLWKLEVKRSGITDLTPLADAHALRYVTVENTGVASLAPLHGHERLWEVWCRDCNVTTAEADALRAVMNARPPAEKPSGGMDRRDVYGP